MVHGAQVVNGGSFFTQCSGIGGSPKAVDQNDVDLPAGDCDFSKNTVGTCVTCREVCVKPADNGCDPAACNTVPITDTDIINLYMCNDGANTPATCDAGETTPKNLKHCRQADGSLAEAVEVSDEEYLRDNGIFTEEEVYIAGAAAALAVAAPSGLGLFGGSGFLGQPGITLGGGGILPAAAFTVICINIFWDTFHAMQNLKLAKIVF